MRRKKDLVVASSLVKHIDRLADAGILPLRKGKAVKPVWHGAMRLHPPAAHPTRSLDQNGIFKLDSAEDAVQRRLQLARGGLKRWEQKTVSSQPLDTRSLRRHVKMARNVENMPGNSFGTSEMPALSPVASNHSNHSNHSTLQFNSRIRARALGGYGHDKTVDLVAPSIRYPEDELKEIFYHEHVFELARPLPMVESSSDLNHKSAQDWTMVAPDSPLDLVRNVVAKAKQDPTIDIRQLYMDTVKQFRVSRAQQDVEYRLKQQDLRKIALPALLDKFDAEVAHEVDVWKQKMDEIRGDTPTAKHSMAFARGEIEKIQKRAKQDRLVLLRDDPKPATETIQLEEAKQLVEHRKLMLQREKEMTGRKMDF